jgi:hypothetical protein
VKHAATVPAGFVRVTAGGRVAVVVESNAEDARRMLERGTLYEAAMRDPAARPMEGRGIAYAVPLPATRTRAVVRHNRHGGLLAPLTRDLFLPPTRAPRELEISLRLRGAGIATPEMLMYGTSPAPFPFLRADVVTREIEHSRDLAAFMSPGRTAEERGAAWSATRDLLRTMHDAGVRHHDLNVKNVLLAPAVWGLEAFLLDVDRVTFHARGDARVAAANVARLLRSARKWRDERGATFDENELGAQGRLQGAA